ncbi:MAG TPA: hypothetical protein VIC05_12570 [Solirubrobacteraceae bacterium]|jgi:hypothetical protein
MIPVAVSARRLAAIGATALALLFSVVGAVASAHRSPNSKEAAAISRAVHRSPARGAVRCFSVRGILVSSAGPWARARIYPCSGRGDDALVVLEHRGGRWTVRDLGTADTGCSVAPIRVRRDLKLVCA